MGWNDDLSTIDNRDYADFLTEDSLGSMFLAAMNERGFAIDAYWTPSPFTEFPAGYHAPNLYAKMRNTLARSGFGWLDPRQPISGASELRRLSELVSLPGDDAPTTLPPGYAPTDIYRSYIDTLQDGRGQWVVSMTEEVGRSYWINVTNDIGEWQGWDRLESAYPGGFTETDWFLLGAQVAGYWYWVAGRLPGVPLTLGEDLFGGVWFQGEKITRYYPREIASLADYGESGWVARLVAQEYTSYTTITANTYLDPILRGIDTFGLVQWGRPEFSSGFAAPGPSRAEDAGVSGALFRYTDGEWQPAPDAKRPDLMSEPAYFSWRGDYLLPAWFNKLRDLINLYVWQHILTFDAVNGGGGLYNIVGPFDFSADGESGPVSRLTLSTIPPGSLSETRSRTIEVWVKSGGTYALDYSTTTTDNSITYTSSHSWYFTRNSSHQVTSVTGPVFTVIAKFDVGGGYDYTAATT